MMTIKTMWFYAALAAAVCGGGAVGAVAFQPDLDKAMMLARAEMARSCADFNKGKSFEKGNYQNSRGKGF